MTVEELIEKLKECPEDAQVIIEQHMVENPMLITGTIATKVETCGGEIYITDEAYS